MSLKDKVFATVEVILYAVTVIIIGVVIINTGFNVLGV